MRILNGIASLADFNLAIEPSSGVPACLRTDHTVICDMLRAEGELADGTRHNPLGIATQALQHICSTPDDDATVFKERSGRRPPNSSTSSTYNRVQQGPANATKIVVALK